MKKAVIFIIASLIGVTANAATLETKSFTIDIESHCADGAVSCNNVSYTGVRKSDGAKLSLAGRALNKEGATEPYAYEFKDGAYTFLISAIPQYF